MSKRSRYSLEVRERAVPAGPAMGETGTNGRSAARSLTSIFVLNEKMRVPK